LTLNANFVQPVFAQAANKAITRLLTVLASFATQQFQTVSSANLPTTQCSAHSASEAMVSSNYYYYYKIAWKNHNSFEYTAY
jgi:hypothetical protein